MTALNLTFAAPAPVALTGDGSLTLTFPSPQSVTLSAVGMQGASGSGGGGGISDGDKGDITVSGDVAVWTIDAGVVSLSKMADLATSTILGRATAGTGSPEALTAAQVRTILNVADGATANASDAFLLARANHTGTQAASTITGLAAIATSGSAADLTAGTLPAARFDDTAHGSRAGGALHANVVAAGAAGFMTGADKSKLDAITGTNTGDVTFAGTPNYLTIVGQVITRALIDLASHVTGKLPFANIADMANGTLFYRKTAGAGAPETQTLATLKTDLGLTGTNSGDQTITLTGMVTGSGTGSFATSLGSFTKAQLDAAVSDGNVLYVGDVTTNATHTGDATGATALTLATVNANVGSFGSATQVATFTVDGKGRTTAAGNTTIAIASTAITDFNSAARAQVEAELIAGTNVTITPGSSGATRTLTIAASGGGGGSLTVQDEGSTLSTAVTTINFTGAGVTATGTTTVTVNVPGGGSSATPWGHIMAARQGLARL